MQHYNNKLFIIFVVIKVAVHSPGREGLVKVSTMTIKISGSFGALPELVIDQDNISGKCRKCSKDFMLAVELRVLELNARFFYFED